MSALAISHAELRLGSSRRRRGLRVAIVLIAVVCLSLGDLYSTLTHVNTFGMVEANPVAAQLMAWGPDWTLVLFKLGTVGIAVGLLLRVRQHISSEVGAWILLLIMTALTVHWHRYNAAVTNEFVDIDLNELPDAMRALAAADKR